MMKFWRKLLKDQSGVSAVEFALLAPILMMLLLGTVTTFNLFQTSQATEKATATIGDILSRKEILSPTCLGNMTIFLAQTTEISSMPRLRVSSIWNNKGIYTVEWTKDSGNINIPLPSVDVRLVPALSDGDSVLLTETFVPHRAFVAGFGVDNITLSNKAIHRPRFVKKITFNNTGPAC